MRKAWHCVAILLLHLLAIAAPAFARASDAVPSPWRAEWPRTDFTAHTVPLAEIRSGGPPKDGIPAIDEPRFVPVAEAVDLAAMEPVIGFSVGDDARAYPLRVLIWHEIVNDVVGGKPVSVTYCPLCNAAIVFDRRVAGRTLDFGTTGKLRHSDLVMYDRQTESWWQQFSGESILGELAGQRLEMLPSRLESLSEFRERAPDGRVLVPSYPTLRPYGANPYVGYDGARWPALFQGEVPAGIEPMQRVVVAEGQAWTLDRLSEKGRIETGDLVLTWRPGQASALDAARIAGGRDVGTVTVQRRTEVGLVDIPYEVTFAFVFHAFEPGGTIHGLAVR